MLVLPQASMGSPTYKYPEPPIPPPPISPDLTHKQTQVNKKKQTEHATTASSLQSNPHLYPYDPPIPSPHPPPLTNIFFAPTGALIVIDGLLYIRQRQQLFQIFTQSLDAIDVTSETISHLNSINAIDVTRYWLNVEYYNVPMFQFSNVQVFQCFNVTMFQYYIGPLVH